MYKQLIKPTLKKIKLISRKLMGKSLFYHLFEDQFYTFQQNKFRGSFNEIKKRQKIYLPYIKKVDKKILTKHSFLDCGFGRGEFLELLRENKIQNCKGVDISNDYVVDALKKGLEVYKNDAISFLYLADEKFSGISSFHVIEHLSFTQMFDFLVLAFHKLEKGGVLILETPNIENMIVSGTSFYYDHTHIQKIPKALLIEVLGFIGFSDITPMALHPIKTSHKNRSEKFLFGSQDLGIVAYK